MEFKITGKHLAVTPAIRDYAQRKTERFHRYFNRIQEIAVVVDQHHHNVDVEIIVDVEHHGPIVARQQGTDLYASIDEVIDKVERQLTDLKTKRRNRKHNVA